MNTTVEIIARSLREIGVEYVFGIVGVPITPIAFELQKQGVGFYGFRNEQACSYASSVVGYLTGLPGVCLTVSGPGMVHALPGLLNAKSNGWPMVLISSAVSRAELGQGGFQESNQVEAASCFCKQTFQVEDIARFPGILVDAFKASMSGRPGPVYIELPTDIIRQQGKATVEGIARLSSRDIAVPETRESDVERVIELLDQAKRPLVIGGKGASYARCEEDLRAFIKAKGIPFLTSPMGKGLLADDDPSVVNAARSMALSKADTVLILGARLNWMFAYGNSPTFAPDVKFIIVDIDASTFTSNKNIVHSVHADLKAFLKKLSLAAGATAQPNASHGEWLSVLKKEAEQKTAALEKLIAAPQTSDAEYLGYHQVYGVLRDRLFLACKDKNYVFVNEGANTMDIGRLCIPQFTPRTRLDAGTLGTMGIGVGYALAAAIATRSQPSPPLVVCVQGDSAFGFSGMEVELAVRYKIPIVFVVINNNGVYEGLERLPEAPSALNIPPTSLSVDIEYNKLFESFGHGLQAHSISTLAQLAAVCDDIVGRASPLPTLLNIRIKPSSIKPKIIH